MARTGRIRALRVAPVRAVMLAIVAWSTPPVAWAQAGGGASLRIRGTVTDAAGAAIEGAQVSVPGTTARAETGARGRFTLDAPAPRGDARVVVRRIGFRPDTVALVAATVDDLRIVLAQVAIPLEAVRVLGRRQVDDRLGGFYRRQAGGNGYFFGPEELLRRNPHTMTDLLRSVPGARIITSGFRESVRFRGSRCAPLVWIDGSPLGAGEFDLNSFDPLTYEGIEVYAGPASVPAEFQGNVFNSSACGTIVLWSARRILRPPPVRPGTETAAAAVARLVEELRVYTAADVDEPARPDSTRPAIPVYPDSLFRAMAPGRVLAEFVVEADGRVEEATVSIVTASAAAFGDAVLRVAADQRFIAARKGGMTVRQVVQQLFEFVPDSTARGRRR